MIFNNSRFSTWQMCRRKYYWRYVLGLEGKGKSDALAFGTAIHEALEAYYNPDLDYSVEALQQIFTNNYVELGNPLILDEYESNKVLGPKLIAEYFKRNYLIDDFGVVQTESTFLVPLGDKCYGCGRPYYPDPVNRRGTTPAFCPRCSAEVYYLAGRTDLITTRNNNYEVLDHKTAASTGKYYYDKYGHHFGMIGYAYGVEKTLNYRVFKYGINVFKKLKTAGKNSKVCPDCRNGKVKKLACVTCGATGHVPMEPVQPFERHYYRVTPEYYDMMIANRIRIAKDIAAEEKIMKESPEIAYPMSCESCDSFKGCPYTNLDWENEDHPWWEPPAVLLADLKEQPDDYVDDMNTLAREEMY